MNENKQNLEYLNWNTLSKSNHNNYSNYEGNQYNSPSQTTPYESSPYNHGSQNNWYRKLQNNKKYKSRRSNKNQNLQSSTKLVIAYLWLYFLAIPCLFIGIIFVDVPSAAAAPNALLVSILLILIGCIFFFIDFIFSILLAIAIPANTNGLKSVNGFDLTFIFFIIGIFLNLFSMVVAFLFLSKIKKN